MIAAKWKTCLYYSRLRECLVSVRVDGGSAAGSGGGDDHDYDDSTGVVWC